MMQQLTKNNYLLRPQPGNIFKRFLAYLLDSFFIVVIVLPLVLLLACLYIKIFTSLDPVSLFNKDVLTFAWYTAVIGKWTGAITQPLYFVYFEQTKWQATPGKKLLKLKVVNFDGTQLSLLKSCTRVFWFKMIWYISYVANYSHKTTDLTIIKSLLNHFLHSAKLSVAITPEYILSKAILIMWFATILFNKQKTGVHEMLSNTKIVEAGPGY